MLIEKHCSDADRELKVGVFFFAETRERGAKIVQKRVNLCERKIFCVNNVFTARAMRKQKKYTLCSWNLKFQSRSFFVFQAQVIVGK